MRTFSGVSVRYERTFGSTCFGFVLDEAGQHIVFQAVVTPEEGALRLKYRLRGEGGELAVPVGFVEGFEANTR